MSKVLDEAILRLLPTQQHAAQCMPTLEVERPEVSEPGQIQFVRVFEQRPAHAFELRVDLLLLPAYPVKRLGRVSDDVKLVEGQPRIGQMFI